MDEHLRYADREIENALRRYERRWRRHAYLMDWKWTLQEIGVLAVAVAILVSVGFITFLGLRWLAVLFGAW